MIDATVIIAAWSAGQTIDIAIQSALAQQDIEIEVIVIDDCSPDNTAQKVSDWQIRDRRVRLERMAENGGPGAARNIGIDVARGAWIAVLDADDRMAPDRLSHMIGVAEERSADIVLGNFLRVDGDDAPLDETPFLSGAGYDGAVKWDLGSYISGNRIIGGEKSLGYLKPLIKRRFLDENSIHYDPRLRNGEDCHLILESMAAGGVVWFDPAPLYRYTVQRGSVSFRVNPDHITALLDGDQRFIARHDKVLTDRTRQLFAERRRALRNLLTSEIALTSLKQGKAGDSLRALWENPRGLGRTLRQLAEAVGKRIG